MDIGHLSNNIGQILLKPAALSFLIALLATPVIIKLAPRLGIMDDPKKRSHPATIHTKPTPRGGGIPIFLAVVVRVMCF